MIDALFKPHMDRLWAPLGRGAARLGLTPNGVTGLSVLLCAANAGAYTVHKHAPAFAVGLLLFEALDNVDGALARATGRCTALGSYLDAVADRYKDAMAFWAVGMVTQLWAACAAGMAGAMLVSYTQARAQAEGARLQTAGGPSAGAGRHDPGADAEAHEAEGARPQTAGGPSVGAGRHDPGTDAETHEGSACEVVAAPPRAKRPMRRPSALPLFERLERVLLLAAGLLCSGIPGALHAALWIGAAGAHLTALQRMRAAARELAP